MGEDDKALSSGGNGKAHRTAEEDIPSKEAIPLSSTSPLPSPPHSTAPHKQPIRPKPSFFSKLVGILIPCVSLSSASRSIEQADLPHRPSAAAEKTDPTTSPKKPLVNGSTPHSLEAESEKPAAPIPIPSAASPESPAVSTPLLPIPPTSEVQTPEDTAGLTSSAVQTPGSTGEVEEKPHVPTQPISADAEDSEGTSYSEDEDLDEQDEEERLLINGGAGIPIGPDGVPKPLLPPISPQHAGRKCLVLDLDETLVHSSFKSISQADYVVPVEIEYHWHNVYVIKRPGVDNFLKKMGELYEVVVFTASLSKYADPVLDKLDIHQVVSHRLFRESCYNHKGNYVKDLSQLGRPIADTIILDNSPASYIFHPNNAVPVSSWFNDPHDTELTDLVPFLADLSGVDDVRGILDGAR